MSAKLAKKTAKSNLAITKQEIISRLLKIRAELESMREKR